MTLRPYQVDFQPLNNLGLNFMMLVPVVSIFIKNCDFNIGLDWIELDFQPLNNFGIKSYQVSTYAFYFRQEL